MGERLRAAGAAARPHGDLLAERDAQVPLAALQRGRRAASRRVGAQHAGAPDADDSPQAAGPPSLPYGGGGRVGMNVESFPEPTRYGLSDRYTYSIYGLQYYTGL